jgi:phospholipase C
MSTALMAACFAMSTVFAACSEDAEVASKESAEPLGTSGEGLNSPIKHTIVIFQENRSFDNYFGTYPHAEGFLPLPGTPAVNGIPDGAYNSDAKGEKVPPFLLGTDQRKTVDVQHGYEAMISAYNEGLMDKYVEKNNKTTPMGHYDYRVLSAYWQYAQHFSLADNWYQPVFGPSTPGALYLVAAQSGNAEKPLKGDSEPAYGRSTKGTRWEGLRYPNIGDRLSEHKVSWAWYQGGYATGSKYTAHHNPFQYFDNYEKGSYKDNVKDYDELEKDIAAGRLPAVVYVKAKSGEDEHAGGNSLVDTGMEFAVDTVNLIMESQYWHNSAIIITYDESGGFWDHVPPPQVDPGPDGLQGLGPRIPTLVISPYAKRNYVSHVQYDTTSVLRFIEWNCGVESLNNRDANAANILDMFDFAHPDYTPYIFHGDGGGKPEKSAYGAAAAVRLNNALLADDGGAPDGGPFVDKSGNVMIPLRSFARNINAVLTVEGKQVGMIFNQHLAEFTLGSDKAALDGVLLELPAKIWVSPRDEAYISVASIGRMPGFAVQADGASAAITFAAGGAAAATAAAPVPAR